jgi:hypothetical protein
MDRGRAPSLLAEMPEKRESRARFKLKLQKQKY